MNVLARQREGLEHGLPKMNNIDIARAIRSSPTQYSTSKIVEKKVNKDSAQYIFNVHDCIEDEARFKRKLSFFLKARSTKREKGASPQARSVGMSVQNLKNILQEKGKKKIKTQCTLPLIPNQAQKERKRRQKLFQKQSMRAEQVLKRKDVIRKKRFQTVIQYGSF